MCKTMDELGELAKAIYKGDKEKQMDGIGDTVVTLICMAEQLGLKFNDCLDYAYNEMCRCSIFICSTMFKLT